MAMEQLALEAKQTAISKPLDKQSRDSIMAMLTVLATYRQAAIGAADLRLYAKRLSCFPLRDVATVLERISREPRVEGQTAFPAIAEIEQDILRYQVGERVKRAQMERDRADAEEFDKILRERLIAGESEEDFCARFPSLAQNWRRWRRGCQSEQPQTVKMNAAGQ